MYWVLVCGCIVCEPRIYVTVLLDHRLEPLRKLFFASSVHFKVISDVSMVLFRFVYKRSFLRHGTTVPVISINTNVHPLESKFMVFVILISVCYLTVSDVAAA